MTLTHKHIADLNYMNVAAQRSQLGTFIQNVINNNALALDDNSVYDLNNMNKAAQNVKLGTLLNSIIDGTAVAINDKQVYDLNNMNVAAQNIQFGTFINDMMDADNFVEGAKLNPFATIDDYLDNYDSFKGKDVYLELNGVFEKDYAIAISNKSAGDANPPKLHLTIVNSEFDGNKEQNYVLSSNNCVELIIKNSRFIDNNNSHTTFFFDIANVQDVKMLFDDCVFINSATRTTIAIIKEDSATIDNVTIQNCYFDTDNDVDVRIGTANSENNSKFKVMFINNNTDVKVGVLSMPSVGSTYNTIIPAGTAYVKTADNKFERL